MSGFLSSRKRWILTTVGSAHERVMALPCECPQQIIKLMGSFDRRSVRVVMNALKTSKAK